MYILLSPAYNFQDGRLAHQLREMRDKLSDYDAAVAASQYLQLMQAATLAIQQEVAEDLAAQQQVGDQNIQVAIQVAAEVALEGNNLHQQAFEVAGEVAGDLPVVGGIVEVAGDLPAVHEQAGDQNVQVAADVSLQGNNLHQQAFEVAGEVVGNLPGGIVEGAAEPDNHAEEDLAVHEQLCVEPRVEVEESASPSDGPPHKRRHAPSRVDLAQPPDVQPFEE
ncbi:uncharacterized protein LOC113361524 [Papaver somniferum]|nr:uncharacterized protein LOC113361524 [Papaver somniferum]